MHYLKGDKVFRLYGIISLTICALHIFIQYLLGKSQKYSSTKTGNYKSYNILQLSTYNTIHNSNKYDTWIKMSFYVSKRMLKQTQQRITVAKKIILQNEHHGSINQWK